MEKDYYGWLVLANSNECWTDVDYDNAFDMIQDKIHSFEDEERNEIIMPDAQMFPKTIYFKGNIDSFEKVYKLLNAVLEIMDHSFGEILVYENEDVEIAWDFNKVTRYQVCAGKINIVPPEK